MFPDPNDPMFRQLEVHEDPHFPKPGLPLNEFEKLTHTPLPQMHSSRHLPGPFKIDIKGSELCSILTEKVSVLQVREADVTRKIEVHEAGVAFLSTPKPNSPQPRPEGLISNSFSEYSMMQRQLKSKIEGLLFLADHIDLDALYSLTLDECRQLGLIG